MGTRQFKTNLNKVKQIVTHNIYLLFNPGSSLYIQKYDFICYYIKRKLYNYLYWVKVTFICKINNTIVFRYFYKKLTFIIYTSGQW